MSSFFFGFLFVGSGVDVVWCVLSSINKGKERKGKSGF